MMRLDKFLALHSVGTRTEIKKLISGGRVKVNDVIAKKPEIHIDENKDVILFDNKPIIHKDYYYVMLNKPEGVITATTGKETNVIDLLSEDYKSLLHPVGRLDKDTTGLLLLTNDGDLTHRLLSPRKHVDKTYEVSLLHDLSDDDVKNLTQGVLLDDGMTMPARLNFPSTDRSICHLTIHEGRFHQIKRMMIAVGNEVTKLKRLSMGSLCLDPSLNSGEYRELTKEEQEALLDLSGLTEERNLN